MCEIPRPLFLLLLFCACSGNDPADTAGTTATDTATTRATDTQTATQGTADATTDDSEPVTSTETAGTETTEATTEAATETETETTTDTSATETIEPTDSETDSETDDPSTTGDPDVNPANRFGIGLVSPGDEQQIALSAGLTGAGGGVRLTFPGITKDMHDAPEDWKQATQRTYDADLVPIIRLGPPWGDRKVRNQSDDSDHLVYGALAQAYADVLASLPKREGWPLYVEVHNETNLCYEWACDPGDGNDGWLGYQQAAAEYAHMLADVADALHALGDPRILVLNGGFAPGGAVSCECGGEGFEPGITSIPYIESMLAAVPELPTKLDAWATHPYPAQGQGWGFFVSYQEPDWKAQTGLLYYKDELAAVGDLPVIITETGWTVDPNKGSEGDRNQVAQWTKSAYERVWLVEPEIAYVLPFQLKDPGWDDFGWADGNGTPYPVYDTVRALRCDVQGGC